MCYTGGIDRKIQIKTQKKNVKGENTMKELKKFWNSIEKEETMILATSAGDRVTMRTISPVFYQDAILVFTSMESVKYKQLRKNPECCIAAGGCFLEAEAQFCGHTMLDENKSLRAAYDKKFKGAFDENIEFGGRDAEFILLKPVLIKGWKFENGIPAGSFEHNFR